MTRPRLLGIVGALRRDSTNRKLVLEAARLFGPAEFAMADLRLPLYDADIEDEQGIPPAVDKLAGQIREADAVIISTPEYNKAPSGVLKNALDWVSRVKGGVWRDKPLAIMSAADGRAGGERSQFALRLMLTPFRPHLLMGPEVMVAKSRSAFDTQGQLSDERTLKLLGELMQALRKEAERHGARRADAA